MITLASLYYDAVKKNDLLNADVARLTASQVLLMVPDEQAADIANWLAQHPEQTETIIEFAGRDKSNTYGALGESTRQQKVLLRPKIATEHSTTERSVTQMVHDKPPADVLMSENSDGVKVIRLPHGGIRVTTRELPKETESQH
ncbi:membrane anchored protein in chemotaxis locus [Shewanella sp. OMA3-2]|uniref:membrane anchored protein in chemotaxis locus n=1 Tax=Shewanella sp. OMA3-2 TaxID=2908650 RepID=UPI003FA6A7C3